MEKKHLILIGFMGSGKSTVGKELASRLKHTFVDTDKLIEEKQGCSIATIFKEQGEQAFRQMETELLKTFSQEEKPLLISTGGGLPLRQENGSLLKQMGVVIWLEVSKATVLERLQNDSNRPLLSSINREDSIEALLNSRREQYQKLADLVIDVNDASVKQIVDQICSSDLVKGQC